MAAPKPTPDATSRPTQRAGAPETASTPTTMTISTIVVPKSGCSITSASGTAAKRQRLQQFAASRGGQRAGGSPVALLAEDQRETDDECQLGELRRLQLEVRPAARSTTGHR